MAQGLDNRPNLHRILPPTNRSMGLASPRYRCQDLQVQRRGLVLDQGMILMVRRQADTRKPLLSARITFLLPLHHSNARIPMAGRPSILRKCRLSSNSSNINSNHPLSICLLPSSKLRLPRNAQSA